MARGGGVRYAEAVHSLGRTRIMMIPRFTAAAGLLAWMAAPAIPLHAGPTPGRFARYSVEQGLSQNTVQAILQDHVGFLWLGTEEGLNRFDGYGFTAFRHEERRPGSLPNDRVTALFEDREGRLWVGTDGGLSLFDRATETFARTEVPQRVTGIVQDPEGTLWVAVEGYGLFERNSSTGVFTRRQKAPDDPGSLATWVPSALLVDRRGRLWVGTKDAGLDMLEPHGGAFIHHRHDPRDPGSLSHDEVWGLAEDRAGKIWVATYGGGLNAFDPDTGAFRTLRHDAADAGSLGSDLATSVLVDRQGVVWAGTDGAGLQEYQPGSGTFRAYVNEEGDEGTLSQNVVRSLYEDRQGQLWVGTYLGGASLMRKARHPFTYYRHEPRDATSLTDSNVTSFLEDAQGHVWVGTGWGGLHRFDPREGTFVRHRVSPELHGTLCLLQDRHGRIWVGTYRAGLFRFDPRGSGASTPFKHVNGDSTTISSDEVWTMVEDGGGALWLGTNNGVDRFDPDRGIVTAHYDTPQVGGSTNPGTRALLFDRQGNLWIGTLGGIHFLPRGQRTLVRIRPDDPALARDGVMALHEDSRGRIWIGTYGGGLKRLDGPTQAPASYTVLPSNVVYGIQEDSAGNLWLSTNHGLSRFDPTTGKSQRFDLSNGLQSLQFNPEASYRTREGRLLFGSVDGFYDFDPAAIGTDTFAPPVVITGLRVFNEPAKLPAALPSLDRITLSYRDKVFSLEFAALDFTLPRSNEYAYRMAGFSDQWLPLGGRREVTFTNLDPATYVFEVKASNSDGVWNDAGRASLRVIVTPPFWGTWWFRSLALAGLTTAAIVAHRHRVRRISSAVAEQTRAEVVARRAEEAYRQIFEDGEAQLRAAFRRSEIMSAMGMLVAGVAHEVRNPLFGISANLDTLEAKLGKDGDRFSGTISRMRLEVERLARLMRELLEYGKPIESDLSPAPIDAVVREALESCAELAAEKRVALVADIPAGLANVHMDRVRLVQVFQNLIQNAVQHSPHGAAVVVKARQEDTDGRGALRIAVEDSGPGFGLEDLPHAFEPFFTRRRGGTGLGLAIVQHIVEAHGGSVGAANRPGGGATVTVTLPVEGEAAPAPPA